MELRKPFIRPLRKSNKGQMPFALIAVTLLILGSAYGVICANINNAEENAEGIIDELKSIDDAIYDAQKMIKTGMGSILNDLSIDENGGNLLDRIEGFGPLADTWMSENFPVRDRGITTTVVSYDLSADVQSLRLSSGDGLTDPYEAAYLKAAGTVTLNFVSSTGSTQKTLNISADGTSALPFIVENATEFELSTEGSASILTQLMSYQLSSLAQTRVINGYGALSENGYKGTNYIITEDDVNKAFRNALKAIETVCFRTGNENVNNIDLAESIVLKNGCYEIDTSSIVAQTLLSIADLVINRWCELFFADTFIDLIDAIDDNLRECVKIVVNFIGGMFGATVIDDSAVKYLKEAMNRYKFSESSYRYVSSNSRIINVPTGTYGISKTGVDGFTVEINEFTSDLFKWNGWNEYISKYKGSTNTFREYIRSAFHSICVDTASGFAPYSVKASEFDSVKFLDSFSDAVKEAVRNCNASFDDAISLKINHTSVPDPLYVAIYNTMVGQRDQIFKESQYRNYIIDCLRTAVETQVITDGVLLDPTVVDGVMSSQEIVIQIDSACTDYKKEVDSRLKLFENILSSIPTDNTSIVKFGLVKAGQLALSNDFVSDKIREVSEAMISDTVEYLSMNSKCGLMDLGSDRSFILYDKNGNTREEFTEVSESYNTEVAITAPGQNSSKCFHNIGIDEISLASYTSVFTVAFNADVTYSARTLSAVDKALGTYDSAYSGSFSVSTILDISCVSGWALTGVDYQSSTNILDIIWEQILKLLSPLIEPLREIFDLVQDLFDICSTAMAKLSAYMTDLINRFLDTVEFPLAQLLSLLENGVLYTLATSIDSFDIGIAKQSMTFNVFGCLLTIELKLASMMETTKNIVKATLKGEIGGMDFSAYADMKYNSKNGVMVKFGGGLENDDWGVNVDIDPLMKFGNTIFSASGNIKDVDFNVSIPERILYEEASLKLSDTAAAPLISNIPLPIAGLKGSFDMGFDLKYNLPVGTGLMINEFESNPEGSDKGREWVELYNGTASSINLSGYMLVPESNQSKSLVITGTTIPALGRVVIYFPNQALNNDRSGKYNGESISLYDPDGKKIDSTPWKKDTYNDKRTWQRTVDGGSKWELLDSTENEPNGKNIKVDAISKTFIVDNLIAAGKDAFYECGNSLKSVEDVEKFLRLIVEKFIEKVINKIANIIVSASIFIELEVSDYTGSGHTGIRIDLEMNSDLVKEGLKWLLNQIEFLKEFVDEPKCNDPASIICENTYFRTTVYSSISAPKFLSKMTGMEVRAGFSVAVNLSTIVNAFGNHCGDWKASTGIVLEGLDSSLLPTGMKSNTGKTCDLWLISMELSAA